jgi:hypothetical protein
MTARDVSEASHAEPWISARDGERLPVAAAAVVWGEADDDDMKWAEEVARESASPA